MAKQPDSHSEMAFIRQSDGLNVIFDQESPSSARSRSRSTSGSSTASSSRSSGYHRAGGGRGRRHRSSSSSHTSSSSASSSRSRSRSHPRCHRRSSRCRCVDHRRYSRGHHRSPPRRYRAHSRSFSRSASRDRYTRHGRSYRSRSRSSGRWRRYRRPMSYFRSRFSRSPSRTYRARSRSRSPGRSVSLSVDDKRKLLEAAKANAKKILGVEKLELPESVKPILSEQSESRRSSSPEPVVRVRHGPVKTESQDMDEPDESSPVRSPRGKITFSINNSVAKPTEASPCCAKVTPRVDSYEGRMPYGHWIPIGSGRSRARKHTVSH